MSLLVKSPSWKGYLDNMPATPSTSDGANPSFSANNVFGAVTALLTAVPFDVEFIVLTLCNSSILVGDCRCSAQLLVDRAGGSTWDTTNSLITGLLVGNMSTGWTGGSQGACQIYQFPLGVPAGASFGIRGMTQHTAAITCRVLIQVYGQNSVPGSFKCGQSVITLGVTNSGGTAVTPGASGSYGSWTSIGSALGASPFAWQFSSQGERSSTKAAAHHHIQMGVSSAQIGHTRRYSTNTGGNLAMSVDGLIYADIPSGAQMQARIKSSVASPLAQDVAIYAVV